jgi:predicted PolB exonuclease-like 3'-5' exonuclease
MSDLQYLVCDIETVPSQSLPEECIPQFDESTVALGNLVDRFKIDDKINKARAAWQSKLDTTMSCDPDLCQIVSAAAYDGDEVKGLLATNETEEVFLLNQIWGMLSLAFKERIPIVGFNSASFDFPVLLRRAMILDVSVNPLLASQLIGRYDSPAHIDLMRALAFRNPFSGKPDVHNLAYYLRRFGIEGKTPGWDGSKVYPAFQEGRSEEILEYNKKDVVVTGKLYERVRPWLAMATGNRASAPTSSTTTFDNAA